MSRGGLADSQDPVTCLQSIAPKRHRIFSRLVWLLTATSMTILSVLPIPRQKNHLKHVCRSVFNPDSPQASQTTLCSPKRSISKGVMCSFL